MPPWTVENKNSALSAIKVILKSSNNHGISYIELAKQDQNAALNSRNKNDALSAIKGKLKSQDLSMMTSKKQGECDQRGLLS